IPFRIVASVVAAVSSALSLLLSGGFFIVGQRVDARGTGPRVVVSENHHDFGDVFSGQILDHVFTIRDEGTSPLTLSDEVRPYVKAAWQRPAVPPPVTNGLLRVSASPLRSIKASVGTGTFPLNEPTARLTGPVLRAPS